MALVDFIDVSKKFGANVILDTVNFSVNDKERIAIIGKNGSGKSTLMKILCGEMQADSGRVIVQNGINIQMLAQNPKFDENLSVRDALKKELQEIFDKINEYTEILNELSQNPDNKELIQKQNDLIKFIDSKDGWQIDAKIERVLENFKLKEYENRSVCTLSGGEIRRVALGALILKKPDVLLLDEPTNHLDVYMVKFLEEMLLNSKQTIVFISHDRYFIQRLATRTVELEDGALKSTLLKILLGRNKIDSGEIKIGDLKIGYFDQQRTNISDDKSLIEIFCPNGGDHIMVRGHYMHVYGYLKNFLFPKEFLDKPVATLSGGEKNRLALAKLFTEEHDCLILDEPTNDLDIATINILEDYLLSFSGAVLIVSHDRYFVDKITNKLWIFAGNGKIEQSHLEYSEYLEIEDEMKEIDDFEKNVQDAEKQVKQKSSDFKLSYKQNKILNEYPDKIEKLETRIKELNHALSTPEIYQKLGLQPLFEELEEKKGTLNQMENEYFEILSLVEANKG